MGRRKARAKYQLMRRDRLKDFMAAYTPEQKELQKKEAAINRLWQQVQAKDPAQAAQLKNEHKEVMDRLIVLAYPPDGHTERYYRRMEVA